MKCLRFSASTVRQLITLVLPFLACLVQGCGADYTNLADGYYIKIVGSQPLFHRPGNEQLWRREKHTDHLVWPYLCGQIVVTNGVAIFTGGLNDSSEWKVYPALFISHGKNPVVELSEPMTRAFARQQKATYEAFKGRYCYNMLSYRSNLFYIGAYIRPIKESFGLPRGGEVALSANELLSMVETVGSRGVTNTYGGVKYVVEPSE